jgi:hypothetical protein
MRWESGKPALAAVLGCLGPPERYRAEYLVPPEARELDFDLWYPAQGAAVFAAQIRQEDQPPVVTRDTQLDRLVVTAAGRVEEIVTHALANGDATVVRDAILPTLKPWPGSVEAIVVHDAK